MYKSSISVDWDDPPVTQAVMVNKQIWNPDTQTFEPRRFVRVKCTPAELRNESTWMTAQFGAPQYQGTWWFIELTNHLWMDEKLATFWYLRRGA